MKVAYLLSQPLNLGVCILERLRVYTVADFQVEGFPEIHILQGRVPVRETRDEREPKGISLFPHEAYHNQLQGSGHALHVGADWPPVLLRCCES